MDEYVNCVGCGSRSLNIGGDCHPYMLASPGCWGMFNDIMAKEFSDLRCWKGHQFTVDAYACQHVGTRKDKRAVNSVNIHLASLYGIFEEALNLSEAPNLRSQFSQYYKGKDILRWLDPPDSFGQWTIFQLWDNDNPYLHFEIAEKWALSVWNSWSHQHETIAGLVNMTRK